MFHFLFCQAVIGEKAHTNSNVVMFGLALAYLGVLFTGFHSSNVISLLYMFGIV